MSDQRNMPARLVSIAISWSRSLRHVAEGLLDVDVKQYYPMQLLVIKDGR